MNTIKKEKVKYGGHETFTLRSTWLSKGCRLLFDAEDTGVDFLKVSTFDGLGIGKNMSKSLAFWLRCTGLATPLGNQNTLMLSEIGKVVFEHDPYFQQDRTLWIMHTFLMAGYEKPMAFKWGFNHRVRSKFRRQDVFERFESHIAMYSKKDRSSRTLNDDVVCFLRSYGFQLAKDKLLDPEDSTTCPLQRLKLIAYYPSSGSYEYYDRAKTPSASVLGLYLSLQYWQQDLTEDIELQLQEILHGEDSPGVVLGLKWQQFESTVLALPDDYDCRLTITKLADGIGLLLSNHSPLQWTQQIYQVA